MILLVTHDDWRSVARIILAVAASVAVVIGASFLLGAPAATLLALGIVLLGGIAVLSGRRRHHAAVLRAAARTYGDQAGDTPPAPRGS